MLPGKSYTPADIVSIVRKRVALLVLPPVITLFGALVFSATVPDLYQSDMLIAIVPQRVPSEFVRSTVTMRIEERLEAITSQVLSRTLLEPIVLELNLYPKERQRLPMEDVVQKMRANIQREFDKSNPDARGGGDPRAFHVRFAYPDPVLATRVTQRLGSLFVDQNARDRGALAEATDEFLDVQLNEARQRLEAQEKRVEAYRKVHGSELPSQLQSNLQVIQNVQLQIQNVVEGLARDRDRKLLLERLYNDAMREPAAAPTFTAPQPAGNGPALPTSAQQQLATARASLAALELRLTPEHPDVVRTKRIVAELEPKAAAERERLAEGATIAAITPEDFQRRDRLRQMKAELESLERQTQFKETEEGRLRDQVAEYQRRIEAVPGVESEWVALTRDYETQQTAYRELLTKSEASKVAVDLENRRIGENFRILDPPRVPTKPVSPKRFMISGIGVAAGLIAGLAMVVLLEIRDGSFRTEADVSNILGLPVLVSIPLVETSSERRQRLRRWALASACAGLVVAAGGFVFWSMRLWTVLV